MIDVADSRGIRTIRLARPEKANALTAGLLNAVAEAAEEAAQDANLRGLILTGTGKVFSAGADLDEIGKGLATDPAWGRAARALADFPCLSVACLNGTLAGGAFGLALACDLRVSVPQASFFYPVMRLGNFPQPPDAPRMAVLVGPSRAKLLLLAGQKIGAEEALQWGLIDRIFSADRLEEDTRALFAPSFEAPDGHAARLKIHCFQPAKLT